MVQKMVEQKAVLWVKKQAAMLVGKMVDLMVELMAELMVVMMVE